MLVEVQDRKHPLVRHERWNLIGVECLDIYLNYLASEGITY